MLELLISMALASVGLAGLLALQVTATRGNANSRQFIEAIGVAQEHIETLQLAQYANLSTLAEGSCTQPQQPITNPTPVYVSGSPTSYSRCTQVNVVGNTTYLKVVVQWKEFLNNSQANHFVTVETTRSP
jgi:type II secretory pathway pseudopilin PulG